MVSPPFPVMTLAVALMVTFPGTAMVRVCPLLVMPPLKVSAPVEVPPQDCGPPRMSGVVMLTAPELELLVKPLLTVSTPPPEIE
jgi:hypothetical protein